MSTENSKGLRIASSVASVATQVSPAMDAPKELKELLEIYDRLIAVLRETYDEGLDNYTDGIVGSVVRWRKSLAQGIDDHSGQEIAKEMKAGLHEFPRNLRSLLPGLGPRLGESIEHKLGIQFAKY